MIRKIKTSHNLGNKARTNDQSFKRYKIVNKPMSNKKSPKKTNSTEKKRVLIKCADELLKCSHRFISGQDINLCTHKN